MEKTILVTVSGLTRHRNSESGNPRYTVHTDQGAFEMKPDAALAYEVSDYLIGKRITVTYDGNHRMLHFTMVDRY